MSYILHIDTATKVCSVALSKSGQLIAVKESNDENYTHGENLTLFIQNTLNQAEIQPKNLSAVSIASGPGSYTGLRIGVATAKGLCYALGIPLIAIDSLTGLIEQGRDKYPEKTLCGLIDARRMEVYNLFVDKNGSPLKEISADIIDEYSYSEFEPFIYFGDGASKLKDLWNRRKCEIDEEILSSAKGQVKLAFSKFQKQEFEDVAYFEPFYLKDFIAGKPKKQ